jgi:hypothetical protein
MMDYIPHKKTMGLGFMGTQEWHITPERQPNHHSEEGV